MAERRRRRRNRGNQTPGFIRNEQARANTVDEVKQWSQRITQARRLRERWEQRYQIEQLVEAFGGAIEEYLDDPGQVNINRIFPTIKAMMPGLMFQNPTFLANATSKSTSELTRDKAKLAETLLKAIADQDQHLKREAKFALQQAFFRVGVLKVLYDPTTERNPRAGEEVQGEFGPMVDPSTSQPVTEPDEVVKDEVYEWRWVDAANMLFPDAGPSMRHWPWVAEEITVSLEEAQDDARFPQALRDQLRPATTHTDRKHDATLGGLQDPVQRNLDPEVTYVEIWDRKNKRHKIYAEGQPFSASQFLMDEDIEEGTEGDPYAMLIFNPTTDPKPSPWPKPVTADWLNLQRVYNIRRQQMINAANRSTRKVGYDEATFPNADEAIAALQSTTDMEAVKLSDVNRPWVTVTDPSSPPDIAREMIAERQDWIDVTGQTGARLGDSDSDTATEAVISERANNLRDTEQRAAVQDWLADAGQKMWQKVQQTLTLEFLLKLKDLDDEQLLKVIGQTYGPQIAQVLAVFPAYRQEIVDRYGADRFLRVSREDLQFEAQITVTPGSARARSLDLERQQMLAFIRIIAQFPHILLSRELLRLIGDLFEMVDSALIAELHAVGKMMMQAQQQKGGAGGGNGSAPGGGGAVVAGQLRNAMLGANANAVL